MQFKSLLLTSVILSLALTGFAHSRESEEVKVYARGDYAGVIKLLEPKYHTTEANIQQRLILARAYLHLGRADDALGVLKSVLKSDRESPEANSLTGKILHESGRDKEALEYLKHAFRLRQDAATASTLGQCYYALGQFTKAKVYLEKALSQDIRDPTNSYVLGKICLARGLGALAERYLLMAQDAGMASAELYLLLGRAYLLQRKYVGPILVRRLSRPAMPGDIVNDYVVLGSIERVANQYKVCTRDCALYEGYRLLKADPNSGDAQFMLARGWLAVGNKDLAARHLSLLLQQEKQSVRAVDLQVRLLLARKEYARLEKALDAAKDAKVFEAPKIAKCYYQAAMMLRAEGCREEAARMLKKAESYTPASAPTLRSLASLYLGAGRCSEALRYYTRLVELFPDAHDIDELRNTQRVLQEKMGVQE